MGTRMPSAVVTGASSGIGRAIAEELAARGFDLVLVARSQEHLEALRVEWAGRFKIAIHCEAVDLSEAAELDALCQRIGVPDVLVNNAGFGDYRAFHQAEWDKLERLMRVNMLALTRLVHQVLPGMRARGSGRILNVASSAAYAPGPLMAVYFATKAYVLHFSDAVSAECTGSGVTVTTLCPGSTATEFHKVAGFTADHALFRAPLATSASRVARAAVKALFAGRRIVHPGIANRFSVFAVRFVPRAFAAGVAYWVLRR